MGSLSGTSTHTCIYMYMYIQCTCIYYYSYTYTILCRASALGRSQLKHQNLRVGGYIHVKEVLKWFNYPHARAHPGYKVSCQRVPHHCFVHASARLAPQWRSCIVLQSGPTRSLIAKFPQRSIVTCGTRILCWKATDECVRTFDA